MDHDTSDGAITSVVGEMLILVLVIILVSLFATSAFSLLPGDRETVVNVAMNDTNTTHFIFWHKGGDWVEGQDLILTATPVHGGNKSKFDYNTPGFNLTDCYGNATAVFDLGGRLEIPASDLTKGNYSIRLSTVKNVVYAGEFSK